MNDGRPETALLVFARAPEDAKRRLAAQIGRAAATRVAAALLEDALARAAASGLAPLYLYWDGPAADPRLERARASGYRVAIQEGNDLGARMRSAFERVLAGCGRALLIGTDCPDLDAERLVEAGERLRRADALLVPATDGGYVAIGLARPALPHLGTLFTGLDWGTDKVAADTRERIARAGLAARELAPLEDLDDADDLARLVPRHPFLAATLQGTKINMM